MALLRSASLAVTKSAAVPRDFLVVKRLIELVVERLVAVKKRVSRSAVRMVMSPRACRSIHRPNAWQWPTFSPMSTGNREWLRDLLTPGGLL